MFNDLPGSSVAIYNRAMEFLQHPDLTVTSEERVLNAILLWSMHANELRGWDGVDEFLRQSTPEDLFRERLESLGHLLPLIRFPLMPLELLKKVHT